MTEAINRVNAMVGIAPVKRQIKELAATAMIDAERAQMGLPVADRTMHLVFTGAPGTGKTTVAREIGQMYYALGLVDKDPSEDGWREVRRADLVGEYQGQTAAKVKGVFDGKDGQPGIKGGVLFVDEAYDLYHGSQDAYGREAVTELLAQAENNRSNTVVILAGYGENMQELFQSNPGLRRRFPTSLNFPEMSLDDRYRVMQGLLRQNANIIGAGDQADEVREAMVEALSYTGAGNAGDVRNLYDKIMVAQKVRLAGQKASRGDKPYTKRELSLVTVDDVRAGMAEYAEQANVDEPIGGKKLVPTGRQKASKPKKPRGHLKRVA